ncbi:PH domain-containing protein [Mumia zhuanghuii]|uniref:PH domain-containing protein n=2 Tax=Mumia TaxID=1546255 RepID=A0ABW1QS53_9ACTN|nr:MULTISPECIES: PH domain-containing protein [Mumia]KAA1420439.1 PH domain-containing protein [Mumia zhuanghuii]
MAPGSEQAPLPSSGAPEAVGERTHPASALVRVWIWVAAGLVAFGRDVVEGGESRSLLSMLWIGLAIVGAAALLGVAFGYLSWRFTRYFIDGREIRIERGILTRTSRRAPYERIQSVDIAEPFAARVFRLCELRIELAGGDDSRVSLQYLRHSEADRLRAILLQRAYEAGSQAVREFAAPPAGSGPVAADPTEAGAAPVPVPVPGAWHLDQTPPILVVPPTRLVVSTVASAEFLVPAAFLTALVVGGVVFPGVIVFGVVPLLLWAGQVIMSRVIAQWDFTLRRAPTGLHVTRGLLSRISQTVPYDRVQAVVVRQAALWRPLRLERAEVTVAGGSNDSDDSGSATLVPVATPGEVRMVIGELFADVDHARVPRVRAPGRSWLFAPVGWRFRAAGSDAHGFVAESGWIMHRTDVLPHAKTQSVAIKQGPLQRLRGVADIEVHTPDGPVAAHARSLDATDVRGLATTQLALARQAREALGEG